MSKYVAFLRGINVGGNHKVPMADLRQEMEKMNFTNVVTLLNSGNIVFESNEKINEKSISNHLERTFGFPIPTIIRKFETISALIQNNPFKEMEITNDLRLYVTFLRKEPESTPDITWKSPNNAYSILQIKDSMVFSVLDVSISKTTKAMDVPEKYYGKDITTRNWNTIERIANHRSKNHGN